MTESHEEERSETTESIPEEERSETTKSNPFDPASLRLSQDFGADLGVEKLLRQVPVRKPPRQDFFRVRADEVFRLDTAIIELKEDREYYLIAPEMRNQLLGELQPVRVFTCVNRQGVISLWPCKLPGLDGRQNPWHQTALEAAELAMKCWVRVVANMSLGGYETFAAQSDIPDPEWPEHTLQELLGIAFGSHFVDRPDHPLINRLLGRS